MKDLIGKRIKGFKFEDKKYNGLVYNLYMDKHIGEVGEIDSYNEYDNSYMVHFKDDYLYYPASLIEQHLVEEWEIGKEYEFSDFDKGGYKAKLLAIVDHEYKYVASVKHMDYPIGYKHIRHIEPQVKEVTLEDIAEKFGVSVESIKIVK